MLYWVYAKSTYIVAKDFTVPVISQKKIKLKITKKVKN